MGRIENVVRRFTVQTCVYWGSPVNNGTGGWTFADPVEIACRWDDKQELRVGFTGNSFTSQSIVLVNQDLDRRGYLFNGTLLQLQAIATAKGLDTGNPVEFTEAFIIQQFEKIPAVRATDDFVRTAYLYQEGA